MPQNYGPHAHSRPALSIASPDGESILCVVRCLPHDAPALAIRDQRLEGGGIMVCLEGDEAQAVADALHQSVDGL